MSAYFGEKPGLSATQGLGPHHAADEHAHLIPGFTPKSPKGESLSHAIVRMRTQGYSDDRIRGQINKWHPKWSEGQALNAIDAAEKVRSSGGSALQKFSPGGGVAASFNHAPQSIHDLRVIHKAYEANPALRTIAAITSDPLGLIALGKATKAVVNHPDLSTGVGAGIAAAGILPVGKLGRALRAAKESAEAERVTRDVAPYISKGHEVVGSVPYEASSGTGFVYHRTSVDRLSSIRREGLKPATPTNDIHGVYFTRNPLTASRLAGRGKGEGSVYVRARADQISGLQLHPHKAYGEELTPHAVGPEKLEYLGEDGNWHPVAAGSAHTTEGAAKIREAIPGMRVARGKQNVLYSEERKARVAKAQEHLNNADLHPDQRIALAKNELKGELPKINYKGLTELDAHAVQTMKTDVLNHPNLLPFQKIRAADALEKAHAGGTLQKNEIDLLQHIFGKQPGLGHVKPGALKNGILSALNIPRSLMASVDLSAPFRQGLVVSTRHPAIFAKNFGPMVKAFGSEKVYRATLDEIKARPSYPMMQAAKLNITDLGHAVGDREEQFASDFAEKLTGGKASPVRASGRAYTGFLDKTRADVFDHLIQRAQSQSVNVHDEKFLKDLGRYINSATGRGPLGPLQGAAKGLNTFFFSPRLLASRVDMIFSPLTYAKADPFVRKEALRSMFQLAGTASTLVALASQIPGVKVVTDPRNPDWGKIKKGNTRIDIGGGFQQPLRLFAQIATGTAISSTTGKKLNLTANGFGQPTRLDLVTRFFEGKESPWASVATDYLRNSNQIGQKFSWGNEAYTHLTPLLAQDVRDVYNDRKGGVNGIAAAFGGAAIGSVGFGLQTYGPVKPKSKSKAPQSYFGNSSSGGSDYFSNSSSAGGSSYFK